MSLRLITESIATSGSSLTTEIPPDWTQGRTGYGGLTAALCLKAAQELEPTRPLRSAFIGFVGPSSGKVTVHAEALRVGRNTSSIRSSLSSAQGPGVEALFTFSAARQSVLNQEGPTAPVAPPSPDTQAPEFREGAPQFTRHLEFHWASDTIPFANCREPRVMSWVRHRDPASRDHPLALLCLADALPPAIATTLDGFSPLSSMTWMVDFFDDTPETENGWWLLESRSEFATGGHSTQDMTIWNTQGNCVAKGRQMVTVFA
ncbi:thioesterase family protein [Congregibacter variabilis]|uniref:Thioesterase family protein n=1 Tax=Congregibacter variabilis TaxID=3081200 RepID=A0ABZ0I045_9GAMM|nr:thioesterase family protein [Congregibacter sp. IMCC43200]